MRTFSEMLGGCPEIDVFEALANAEKPMTIPDIAEMTDVPRTSLYRIMERFVSSGLALEMGRRRKALLYGLNWEKETVRAFAFVLSQATVDQFELDMGRNREERPFLSGTLPAAGDEEYGDVRVRFYAPGIVNRVLAGESA